MTADKYIIHLIKCALNDEQPLAKPDDMSWDTLFVFAKRHMIANILWYSVNRLDVKPDTELWKKWTELKNMTLAKDITQRSEFNKITAAFENAQLRCMPVKGVYLKELYPKSDFRTMSDIDILIDADNQAKAESIMLSLGYTLKSSSQTGHDVFYKPPVMNVEIHKQLFSANMDNSIIEYYNNTFTKSKVIDGCKYIYKMTGEEFYVYILAHFYKHYSGGGSGIRSVIDIYILNHSIYAELNKQYLNDTLKKLNLTDFSYRISKLADVWFGEAEETSELNELAGYILGSGTYGTISNQANNLIRKKGRIGYLLSNAFLPLEQMKSITPVLNKAPFLLPFCWLWRWVKAIAVKHDVVAFKLKVLFTPKK